MKYRLGRKQERTILTQDGSHEVCQFNRPFKHLAQTVVDILNKTDNKMKFTIEDLAQGKCAVINDGTLEELREVLKLAFPDDKAKVKGTHEYYIKHDTDIEWTGTMHTRLPTQSVKDFLPQSDPEYKGQIKGFPKEATAPQPHYDNSNGSLYAIAEQLQLNHYEFDIFKRLVRCRKKGEFEKDLNKIKDTVDIYLKEWNQ